MEMLSITLAISIIFNLALFIPAYIFKTDKLTDLSYSLTFILLIIFVFSSSQQNIVNILLLGMIILWALRLGIYLFIRINKTGRDKRFDNIRTNFFKFLNFWLLQGLSVWIILIPSILLSSGSGVSFSYLHILGIAVWFIGLLIETVADYQKYQFKKKPENKSRWTDVGLWRRSRHPNYFGEILVWIGIYMFAIVGSPLVSIVIGIISPLYIITLLLFVSGVPTIEKKYDERFKDNIEYQKYKEKTNLIILKQINNGIKK